MDMTQQGTGDQMESSHRKLDYGTPTDDEEVTLPPHDRATEVPDFLDTDIRDRHTLLDTQREDCYKQSPYMGLWLYGTDGPPTPDTRSIHSRP